MPISLSGSLVLTGSITTTGGITISGSILSASYSATSSFSNDFTVLGNLTVFGTQSVQYITSSQLNVSDNVITVNVASPGVRFGGLSVFDSGSLSSESTASLFWDSQQNHWIYQRESGSTYDGGMLISGPRNSAGLGNESGTTACMLLVGQGGDHLTSSMIYHSSAVTCIGTGMSITSAGATCLASTLTATAITATGLLYANGGESNTLYTGAFLWTPGSYNFINQKTDHSLVIGTYNANSPVAALTITQAGTSIFSNTVCASTLTAATVSAGSPTNSRIVANANQMYGYYDVEANPRWTLGRDVWAGGAGGLAFGVGGTTTCYSMIGDPSGFGCTIAFATLVPTGCSGTTYEKMRITSCGKVGIGAIDPRWLLEICCNTSATGGGGYPAISINNPNDAGYSALYFFKGANNFGGLELSNGACHLFVNTICTFAIQTNNNERLRVNNNGFVGVATASPKAVFDVACGNAHSIISTWCKLSEHNIMYNGFDIVMNESSFAGQLYVQANGAGIGIQSVFDVLANYDRICVIQRNSIRRGSEILIIPSYFFQAGSKRICIQQCNGSGADMSISAMLIGTAYGGSYICAQA